MHRLPRRLPRGTRPGCARDDHDLFRAVKKRGELQLSSLLRLINALPSARTVKVIFEGKGDDCYTADNKFVISTAVPVALMSRCTWLGRGAGKVDCLEEVKTELDGLYYTWLRSVGGEVGEWGSCGVPVAREHSMRGE